MADHVSRRDVNNNLNIQGRASTADDAEIRNIVVDSAGALSIAGSITATPGVVGAGTAAAAGRVTLASDDPAVTALQVIDDWDESDRCKVNLIVGQAGVAANAGAASATTQRVVTASDSPDVTSLAAIAASVDTLEALLAPLVPGGNLVDTTGTAGTPEQINAGNSQACRGVMLSNWSSSSIAAGFSNAVDVALKTGVQIGAGKSMFFPCTNTNQIWVDVTTNGDAYGGVYYT